MCIKRITESGHDSNTNSKLFSRNDIKGARDDHVHLIHIQYYLIVFGDLFQSGRCLFHKEKHHHCSVLQSWQTHGLNIGIREGGCKNQHSPFSSYEEDKMTAAKVSMTQSLVCSMGWRVKRGLRGGPSLPSVNNNTLFIVHMTLYIILNILLYMFYYNGAFTLDVNSL